MGLVEHSCGTGRVCIEVVRPTKQIRANTVLEPVPPSSSPTEEQRIAADRPRSGDRGGNYVAKLPTDIVSKGNMHDYRISRKILGKGKFSNVHKAQRKVDGLIVVMKKLIKFDPRNEVRCEKCFKEVRLLQKVQHPNVIALHDCFLYKRQMILVFDYAPGGDLKQTIQHAKARGRRFEEGQAWRFFVEICAGVNHLHEKRILHRDLKPANVFVGERGELKVGDLGLGRPLSDQTLMANSKVGTPLYMAPDILDGKSYDYKCDVWSLGCLLFELAALISPFKQSGISLMELCTNIKTGVPANTIPCYYSKSLHTLAGAMLSVDPDARPAVATVLPQATAMLARWTVGHAAAQRPRLPTPPTTVASAGQGMRRGRSICKSKSTKGSTQNSNRSVNDSEKVWRIKHQLPRLGEFMGERDMASLLSSCRACKCALCSFKGLEPKHQQQHQQQHQQVPEKQAATAKKGGLVGDMDEPSMEDINKLGNYARRRSKECEASESVHDSSRAHDNSSGGDSDLDSSRSGSASGSLTGTCTVSSSGIDAGASSSSTAGGNSSMLTGAPTPKYSKTQNLSLAPDIVRRDNGKHAAMVKAASLIPSLPAASMSMSSRALSNFGSNGKGNKVGKGTGISARPRLTTTLPTTSSTAIRAAALAAASTDTSTLDLSPPITAAKGNHDMVSSSVGPGAPLPLPRRPRTPPRNRQVQLVGKSGRAPGGGAPRGGARRPSNGRRLLRLRSEPTKVAAMGVPHPPAITA